MMDVKKLIERLRTESLYKDKATLEIMDLCMDAATAIEALRAELARVTAERDVAVEDLRKHRKYKCDCCYYADKKSRFPCADCQSPISTYGDGWKWRGIKKED